jgi:hypothetical protein
MSLYNPSRDQARQFLFDAWAKFKQAAALSDLEKIAVEVLQMHPEYHAIFNVPEQYLQQAYFPEMGVTNPFLHISLHLSVIEQISIDQPTGIKALHAALREQHADEHSAYHDVMDCLAETLWQAQRDNTGPDGVHYLQLLQQKVQA